MTDTHRQNTKTYLKLAKTHIKMTTIHQINDKTTSNNDKIKHTLKQTDKNT
jgi:hypothetical protein